MNDSSHGGTMNDHEQIGQIEQLPLEQEQQQPRRTWVTPAVERVPLKEALSSVFTPFYVPIS